MRTPARILVVDDNTNNVQLLVNLLSEKGYDVEYALNGTDATCEIEQLSLFNPD